MPRTSRKIIGNIFMHNMVQGIDREYIFQKEKQKCKYIKLLKKYKEKYNILILAYCIMDNHAHILTYSQEIKNISLFMKDVNTEYAIYYNKSNNRVGYVFRNRFSSKPIYNQEYLLKCIKYIHMNPVKAGISKKEEDYEFSSYKDYLNQCGVINLESLNIIFNSEKEYLKKFNSIEYESLNLEKAEINIKYALEEFLKIKNLRFNQIQKNSLLIKEFISYLISKEYLFTKKDIAQALNISRASLYRRLN